MAPTGVIRVDGDSALLAVSRFASRKLGAKRGFDAESGRGVYEVDLWLLGGRLRIDADLWVFRAPKSATGNDTVEIHMPSGPALLSLVTLELSRGGARLATPGEFSRRAFVAGKMDLSEAEAVLSMIAAENEADLLRANRVREGALHREVNALTDLIENALVPLELSLDFSDQDVEIVRDKASLAMLAEVLRRVEGLCNDAVIRSAHSGQSRVVLMGKSNSGKSCLFNALADRDLALVSDRAGTTRDSVVSEVTWGGVRLTLVDTAGHDFSVSLADQMAHSRTQAEVSDADLVLEVVDLPRLDEKRPPPVPRCLRVVSMLDLATSEPELRDSEVSVSALYGRNLGALREAVLLALSKTRATGLLLSARQLQLFQEAEAHVKSTLDALREGHASELCAAGMRRALRSLLEVIGRDARDAVLDRIFAGFCIGK